MAGWERAFVLDEWPYSETSLMVDLFTEGHGWVRLLAKGARSRRSNLKGCLQPFTSLLGRYGGRGEVKTMLRNAEAFFPRFTAQRHDSVQQSVCERTAVTGTRTGNQLCRAVLRLSEVFADTSGGRAFSGLCAAPF